MNRGKVDEFIKVMKKRGYTIRTDKHFPEYNYVVSKNNFHHVSLKEEMIAKAPLEYLIDFVEHEFAKLEKITPNQ